MDAAEPRKALFRARQFIALDHRYQGLDVYPPEFLVPLQLLQGAAQTVHEVEDAAILLVPTVLHLAQGNVNGFLDKVFPAQTLPQIHNEPHGLDGVTGILQTAFVAVHQFAVLRHAFHNHIQFRAVEHIQYLMQADVDGLAQESGVEQVFNLQSHVAEYHRQVERLQRTRSGCGLAPPALGIVALLQHNVECPLGNIGIFRVSRGLIQLTESNHGKRVGKDVIGFDERLAVARQREIPVEVAVVPVLLQELRALYGGLKPLAALFHLVVQRGEHPHFAPLQPDELIGVVDLTVALDAREIASILTVYASLHPEGHDSVQQLTLVLRCQCLEIHFHNACHIEIMLTKIRIIFNFLF